ncbi:MAG TPA: metal-dependent hydrolase [Candidatus Acidoferrum sp.]|nr:metal-dependent hydrolase [Candidatus Acidoferrum sp.]
MDTITHGIAGALIGKAVFRGEDLLVMRPMNRRRIITWALMLGAIFPDSDVLREMFSDNELLIVTWHRSITHSVVCLPLFAMALAGVTRLLARRFKWDAPGFGALTGIYGVGILSHILLDLVTSFGTMIWSPIKWSRPAWDLIFIVDFTFTAILLLPQLLAWVYVHPEKLKRRALGVWLVFAPAPLLIAAIGRVVGAPISNRVVIAAIVLFTGLFLLPALRGWGLRVRHSSWNFAGFVGALAYIALALSAHHAAFARVEKFASWNHLEVETIGALPSPPSLWQWAGLIRTPRGVYELRMDLTDKPARSEVTSADPVSASMLEYRFYPEALPNSYIDAARRLPEVQQVLWFSRFPVTRFRKEGSDAIVEISDMRFASRRPGRVPGFTYRVRFSGDGSILSRGWARP